MMMVQCMKDVSNKDLLNVNRQSLSTKQEHFIEVKLNQIRLTDKDNYRHISFITRENGWMTCLMEKEDKFMVRTPIMMVTLFKVENKVWVFITGMQSNVTQVSL